MKIGELSKRTGISIRSIRHYDKKNLIDANRLENGYRHFSIQSVERIQTIQMYLSLGLNIDQIKEILLCTDDLPEQVLDEKCEEMMSMYKKKLNDINKQIATLFEVKKRLEKKVLSAQDTEKRMVLEYN